MIVLEISGLIQIVGAKISEPVQIIKGNNDMHGQKMKP
jgi:hypothetical protein